MQRGAANLIPGFGSNVGKVFPEHLSNILGLPSGDIFYVSSLTGSNNNNGRQTDQAKATIAGAISVAQADHGDVIVILPGHSETVTSAITVNKAGLTIIGLGQGSQRPLITGNGTIDAINVTAAGVVVDNLRFAAPETDDQTSDINIDAAGVIIQNTHHIGSQTAKNKTDVITITANGNDFVLDNVRIYNTVVDCVSGVSIEGAAARGVIRNCVIQGTFSTSCLMDEATATLLTIENNVFKNTKTTGTAFNWTNNSTGIMRFNHNSGRNTTLASNYVLGTGMDYFENRLVEEAAVNGAIAPVADTD